MRIVIVGGGFAGIAAAKKVHSKIGNKNGVHIELIDRNEYTTMLPSLPDVAGGKIEKRFLCENIVKLLPKNVKFTKMNIDKIDLNIKKILGISAQEVSYDKLIIATGSKTNFYGYDQNLESIYTMDCLDDATRVHKEFQKKLENKKDINLVIAGAGFTGLELASNLYHLACTQKRKICITIIEKGKKLMPIISQKLVCEIEKESALCEFNILTDEEVVSFDGTNVFLRNNGKIENAFFCWCAGVKVSVNIEGNYQKLGDGRIIVDKYLKIPEYQDVYVTGDTAAIKKGDNFIRRAVNFAYMSGLSAGANLAKDIKGEALKEFKPIDLGWVIPINMSSVGVAMGIQIKGRLGIMMHYLISGAKNYNFRNFLQYVYYAFSFSLKKHTKMKWK